MRIFYFARLVDQLEMSDEQLVLPPDVTSVAELLTWLRARGKPWQAALAHGTVRVTVNKNFTAPEAHVKETDEIAIIPLRT